MRPIICCTAEILANLALRQGADAAVDQVVMDEFHYYGDPDRGWAWQVPLHHAAARAVRPHVGDARRRHRDRRRPRRGAPGATTARVTGVDRPVPLHFSYAKTPVQETVEELLADPAGAGVHRALLAGRRDGAGAGAVVASGSSRREQRDEIAEAIGGFRFTTASARRCRDSCAPASACTTPACCPRYRRLVETLAQRGLLRVICGTDTLGVGINVPIRTVLITALVEVRRAADAAAQRARVPPDRGAGGPRRLRHRRHGRGDGARPRDRERRRRRARRATTRRSSRRSCARRRPQGFVNWGEASFERLVDAEPEPLVPQLQLTAAMLINVIARGGDVVRERPLARLRQPRAAGPRSTSSPGARSASSARCATPRPRCVVRRRRAAAGIRLTVDLQPNFALNQPLSPFALAAIGLLDPDEAPARRASAPATTRSTW